MAMPFFQQVRQAIANLNPSQVRESAERPLAIGLVAASSAGYAAMEDFLSPAGISQGKRWEGVEVLHRASDTGAPDRVDFEIWHEELEAPAGAFVFRAASPNSTARDILAQRQELGLPLARRFPPFRKQAVRRIVRNVSKENALFSMATALPNVVPHLLEVPCAVGEFASDTAFLTVNQVRMAFLLAAASDRSVGYREQRSEIASILAGAFGWRSLARELIGKVPLGGGLIPKAAIAYAGTYVVGASLERLYRIGYAYTRAERRRLYEQAFERGKQVAAVLLAGLRQRTATPPADGAS